MDLSTGRVLVSDAPEFEERWLTRLLEVIAHPVPAIEEYDGISFALFDGAALDRLYETLARHRVPHRAGPDTRRMAMAWQEAMRCRNKSGET